MYYLDEGGRFCVGRLVDARMITALGWGQRLNSKSLWAHSNDDTQQGLGRIACSDLIGNSAVTIRDYGTTLHKRKLVLELTQGGFLTYPPLLWLALCGYLWETCTELVAKFDKFYTMLHTQEYLHIKWKDPLPSVTARTINKRWVTLLTNNTSENLQPHPLATTHTPVNYYKSSHNWDRSLPTGPEQTQNRFRTDSEIFKVGIVQKVSCNFP